MSREILIACTSEPGFPSGPPIIAAAVAWGMMGPYLLTTPATHARVGVQSEDGSRLWLDGASPVAKLSRRDAKRQVTWKLRVTVPEADLAAAQVQKLAGVAYDWPQIVEQAIPFLADHGGIHDHEICTSLVALVLSRLGGRWLALAQTFLKHGNRHPERMLRLFQSAEGRLLTRV